jgi:uncharacterized DUF497 family protein
MLEFEWDEGNLRHIALHHVTFEEAEEAFNSDTLELAFNILDEEERIEELGATASGPILKIVTIQRKDKIRVVTAFDAPRLMKVEYLRQKGIQYEQST